MIKIEEEISPSLQAIPHKYRKSMMVSKNVEIQDGEAELSFENISENSSEMDEQEKRIIEFLEEECLSMADPKEKAWEYAEKIKQSTFFNHSKTWNNKRFTLDNADLYKKRRSSCLEFTPKQFLSPDNVKSKNHELEDGTTVRFKINSLFAKKSGGILKTPSFKLFSDEENNPGRKEEEAIGEGNLKSRTSPGVKDLLKEVNIFKN